MVLPHDYLGSGTAPVGQEVESRWWRQHTAGGSKHWSAELKDKVWGTKTIPVLHWFCQMQFFNSCWWWDCLCNGSYLDRSGIHLVYGTKESACGLRSLVLCIPDYFVFLSYMDLSNLWPVTSYLAVATVFPHIMVPNLFHIGEFHFAWRAGSADEAAAVLWQISAWCD